MGAQNVHSTVDKQKGDGLSPLILLKTFRGQLKGRL